MSKFNLLTTLSLNASGLSEGLKNSIKEVENFVNSTEGKNRALSLSFRDVSEMGVGEMRKELLKLRNISFAGKTQEEITIINKRIGELTDTMGDLKAQQKALGSELGSVLAGGLQTAAAFGEIGVGAAQMFGASKEEAEKYQRIMITLIGTTQAFGTIQNAIETRQLQVIGLKVRALATQATATVSATVAQLGLNSAMNASLYGAAALAVAGLVAGIVYLVKSESEATEAARRHYEEVKRLNEISFENRKRAEETAESAYKSYIKQQLYVEKLVKTILDEGTSQKEYNKAVKELNSLDPTYISNQDKKTLATQQGKEAIKEYLQALKQKAEAEALESSLTDVYVQKFQKQQQIKNLERGKEVYEVQKAALEKAIADDTELDHYYENYTALQAKNKQIEDQRALIKNLGVELKNYDQVINDITSQVTKNTTAVQFNTSANNSNAASLKNLAEVNKAVFDSWENPPNFEYNIPTLTPKGLPQPETAKLTVKEPTVPGFNYDELYAGVDATDALNENLDKSRELANLAAQGFGMLGEAIGTAAAGGEVSFQNMIVSMLGGINQLIIAELAASIMGMMQGEAPKGLPGLITAGIGIAAITALFASLPKFEYGGIVQGQSFTGDNVLARVNSKEMILTQRQQAQLYNIANGSGSSWNASEVSFRIEGDALVGVLNKYSRKVRSMTGRNP